MIRVFLYLFLPDFMKSTLLSATDLQGVCTNLWSFFSSYFPPSLNSVQKFQLHQTFDHCLPSISILCLVSASPWCHPECDLEQKSRTILDSFCVFFLSFGAHSLVQSILPTIQKQSFHIFFQFHRFLYIKV